MAKIFYVTERTPDYAQVKFFKTEKEALKYGASELEGFEMYEEPMNDEESTFDSESYYQGDSLTFKKGILFSFEEGEVYVQAMEEDAAREYVQELGEWGGAIFFDGFKRGMYGYLGTAADGKGYKWDWDGYDLNESKANSSLKHVQLFEQFINESVDVDKLIKHLESTFDWNQGSAREVSSREASYAFSRGPKDERNVFIEYSGMKGQSITKDIRAAIKDFGAKALQVVKENGDNEHYYYIEIKR